VLIPESCPLTSPIHPSSIARTASFLTALIVGLSALPAPADEVVPPAPPKVDAAPPPPLPATVDLSMTRVTVARPVYTQPVYTQPAYQYGDPYGFTTWLNGVRGQYGLGAVGHDPGLSGQAAVNNSYGFGHHYMGSARRQNSGMGAAATVWQMWMASPAHQAALLDPTITMIGIAASGSYWTFNAY
jgi:hypothetical protein